MSTRRWLLGIPVVLAACWVFLWLNFHLVHDPMPIHFGPRGRPDSWATKSLGAAFALVGLGPGMLLLTGLAGVGITRLTADGAGERQRMLAREISPALAAYLFWLSAVIAVDVTGSLLGHHGPLGVLILVGGIILATGMFMWQLVRLHRRVDTVHPPSDADRRGRWGFFYDPEEPQMLVPREDGMNLAFNMARPGAWGVLGALLAIPTLITLLVFLAG